LLQQHGKQLQDTLSLEPDSARIEVQCLLQTALQVDRSYLLTHPEVSLDEYQLTQFTTLFGRRLRGEPIAYLLSSREFYGLDFKVSPATLIPRPETELLVDLALQRIPQAGQSRVLDLGTGSGAIALSIAHARPVAEVIAVDDSQDALEVARENVSCLGISNVRLLRSDWYSDIHGERFDLIVANPPYIAESDVHIKKGDLRYEPLSALVSGADGLEDIRHIISRTDEYLIPGGWLLLEHGYEQAEQVREMLCQEGYSSVFSARDLSGIERVSGAIKSS